MVRSNFIPALLQRVNIVEVIGQVVSLRQSGRNYTACCPFHQEKTPSFNVNVEKQFFYCFGCGAGGDAITFVMKHQSIPFVEAVEELARQVGMTVPQLGPRKADTSHTLITLMHSATEIYQRQLQQVPQALDYLERRGVDQATMRRFALGYALPGWQGLKGKLGAVAEYEGQPLQECGLVAKAQSGRFYDWFRDRLLFPIHNIRGQVVGFGGRTLGNEEPKYLNSPQTSLFEKGREIYGLFQAREAIGKSHRSVVVEGYMDVVALSQHGIHDCVATLGTATSEVQVRRLLQLAPKLIFCFDGDGAGRKAAWKALEVSLPVITDHHQLHFAFLPDGEDPDSLVRTQGVSAVSALLDQAEPLSVYLQRKLSGEHDLRQAEGRAQMLAAAKPLLVRLVQAPALRLQISKGVADCCGLQFAELQRLWNLGAEKSQGFAAVRPKLPVAPLVNPQALEMMLLRLLLVRPARAQGQILDGIEVSGEAGKAIHALINAVELGELTPDAAMPEVLAFFRDDDHHDIIGHQLGSIMSADEFHSEQLFADTLRQLQRRDLNRRIAEVQRRIQARELDEATGGPMLQQLLEQKKN